MYGEKFYRLRGDAYAYQQGGLFSGIGKAIGKVAGLASKITSPLKVIPGVGPVLSKVASKFVPGLGIISTASTALSIAKGIGKATKIGQFRGVPIAAKGGMTSGKAAIAAGAAGAAAGFAGGRVAAPSGVGGGLAQMYEAQLRGQGIAPGPARAAARAATGGRRYRRINPMNVKAARRAIRRIKGVRKITQDIERQLPRARASKPRFAFARARRK
jgi:hypothetical protein